MLEEIIHVMQTHKKKRLELGKEIPFLLGKLEPLEPHATHAFTVLFKIYEHIEGFAKLKCLADESAYSVPSRDNSSQHKTGLYLVSLTAIL
jgi:hypothetical protein